MLTYYSRLLDGVEKVIKILEILLLAAITLIMIYQCIMRYGFHSARPWCEELALYLSIYSVFLGIPIAVRRQPSAGGFPVEFHVSENPLSDFRH